MYKTPNISSFNAAFTIELLGPCGTQYTGTLTIYGVKSAMYSPAKHSGNTIRLVKLDKIKNKIA